MFMYTVKLLALAAAVLAVSATLLYYAPAQAVSPTDSPYTEEESVNTAVASEKISANTSAAVTAAPHTTKNPAAEKPAAPAVSAGCCE
jgi:hypothetical protein